LDAIERFVNQKSFAGFAVWWMLTPGYFFSHNLQWLSAISTSQLTDNH